MSSLAVSLPIFLSLLSSCAAYPLSSLNVLSKRGRSTGANVGLGVGVAVAAILAIAVVIFLVFHFRRSRHLAAVNKERAILAGEKNADGTNKPDKFVPKPQDGGLQVPQNALKRNKSVKDRLMGPLYRGSTIELPRMPNLPGSHNSNRDSVAVDDSDDGVDGTPLVNKPWAENSPRPSFSSKRATRMMMMM